jgi:hypothetical protein
MPGFVDRARIDGRMREFVWLPSVFPPKHPAQDAEGGGQISSHFSPRTGGPGSYAKSWNLNTKSHSPFTNVRALSALVPD